MFQQIDQREKRQFGTSVDGKIQRNNVRGKKFQIEGEKNEQVVPDPEEVRRSHRWRRREADISAVSGQFRFFVLRRQRTCVRRATRRAFEHRPRWKTSYERRSEKKI